MMINTMLPTVLHREINRSLNQECCEAPAISHQLRGEVIEREHGWELLLELPGLDREDVEVLREGDELVVKGVRGREALCEQDKLRHSSRLYGRFEKRYRMSDEIDRQGIEASMEKGLLRLHLKKAEQSMPKKVEIK